MERIAGDLDRVYIPCPNACSFSAIVIPLIFGNVNILDHLSELKSDNDYIYIGYIK